MDIILNNNEGNYEIKLIGRLDTTTAPDLEQTVKDNLEGAKSLIINVEELEYISSAGLRVLLMAKKALAEKPMVIKHVKPEIMEVFEITGFTDILDIDNSSEEDLSNDE